MKLQDFAKYVETDDFFDDEAMPAIVGQITKPGVYGFSTEYQDWCCSITEHATLADARKSVDDDHDDDLDDDEPKTGYYWSDFNGPNVPAGVLWGEGWGFVQIDSI